MRRWRAGPPLLAIALVLDGRSRAEAAELNGMDRQTLSDWVHRHNAAGIDGLKSRLPPGAAPPLSDARKTELRALVVKGPDPEKDKVIRWRRVDLQEEITRRFSVRVHENTVGKWPRGFRLTRLQPRPCHPKTDLAAQETFKKTSPV
jgi:transposase